MDERIDCHEPIVASHAGLMDEARLDEQASAGEDEEIPF
jgi:hypothetical protein